MALSTPQAQRWPSYRGIAVDGGVRMWEGDQLFSSSKNSQGSGHRLESDVQQSDAPHPLLSPLSLLSPEPQSPLYCSLYSCRIELVSAERVCCRVSQLGEMRWWLQTMEPHSPAYPLSATGCTQLICTQKNCRKYKSLAATKSWASVPFRGACF